MALSVKYTPGEYFSAHGDLYFTLLDDVKPFSSNTYPNYKYLCDVYIDGILEARLESTPRPNDKIGIFNIGNVVRNYLFPYFAPVPNAIRSQIVGKNFFYTNVICRFGERYGNTTYSNLIVDSQRTYFNHYNGRLIGSPTILPNYLDRPMTTRPYSTPVARSAKYSFIPFLPTDDTQIDLVIKSYNGSTQIGSTTQSFTPTSGSTNEMQLFNVAPAAINAAVPGFINSGVDSYTVEFSTTNITGDSIYRFDLTCEARYEVYTVHFQNKFGGFESRDFTKVSRRNLMIEKSDYGTSAALIDANGIPQYRNANNVYRETRRVYAGNWKEKMVLNTDLLRDGEYRWLEELVLSPIAYIEIGGYFYPMIITDTTYETRKVINDELTNLTLNIEFGDQFNTQYR